MSGLEILGAAGSVASLFEVAGRVYSTLHTFVVNSKDADVTAQELCEKVLTLQETVRSILTTLKRRRKRIGEKKLEKDEARIVSRIQKSVEACDRFLTRFNHALKGLQREKKSLSWAARARIQLKLENKEATILRLEKNIDTHIQILQTSLACFNMLVNDSHHAEILESYENLLEEIRKSRICLFELQQLNVSVADQGLALTQHLPKGDEPESSRGVEDAENALSKIEDADVEKEIQDWIDEATEVESASRSSASTARERSEKSTIKSFPSDSATGQANNLNRFLQASPPPPGVLLPPRSPSLIDAIASNDQLTLNPRRDPTPDFDDTTDLEPLEELIKNFNSHVSEEMSSGRLNQAEAHQLEAIELMKERHTVHGIEFEDYDDMQSTLADIYDRQGNHNMAIGVRFALLRGSDFYNAPLGSSTLKPSLEDTDRRRLLRKARQYHKLAFNHHQRYQSDRRAGGQDLLDDAERDARRAFKCRRQCLENKEGPGKSFTETVELLVRIYEDQLKPIYAETYRSLYLSNPAVAHLSPSLLSISPRSSISRNPPSESTSEEIDRKDSFVGPPDLISAIIQDREDYVDDYLLQDFNPRASRRGKTAIMHALDGQNRRIILKLLNHSNAHDGQVDDALLYAVWKGDSMMVDFLLEHDADPMIQNQDGHTPLHIAAQRGFDSVVSVLLTRRADPNATGPDALTPLHYAVHENKKTVVLTLLNHPEGANINARNEHGETALHYAAQSGNIAIAEMLLDRKADTGVENSGGRTALETAVSQRDIDFVEMWLKRDLYFDLNRLPERTSPDIKNLFLAKSAESGNPASWPRARGRQNSLPNLSPVNSAKSGRRGFLSRLASRGSTAS